MKTREHRKGRGITESEREMLSGITQRLYDAGWIVLDSQWMKNPRLSHFFAPIISRGEGSCPVGTVRVGHQQGITIMMPTDDVIA